MTKRKAGKMRERGRENSRIITPFDAPSVLYINGLNKACPFPIPDPDCKLKSAAQTPTVLHNSICNDHELLVRNKNDDSRKTFITGVSASQTIATGIYIFVHKYIAKHPFIGRKNPMRFVTSHRCTVD
jgi:hypothetical protein